MSDEAVLVLDCGSTNVRAIAVDATGKVLARASQKNVTTPDQDHDDWHYWPFEMLYEKLCLCSRQVASEIGAGRIKAIAVTTFGADGTFLNQDGKMLFPVVSWKCPRTLEAMDHVQRYIAPERVVEISGVGNFSFNTLNKFVWFRENRPELLHQASHFLFMSSLFSHRMTGRMTNDATMVGTSQMTDLRSQSFSDEILDAVTVTSNLFPQMVFPGEVIGPLLSKEAEALGLDAGTPVVSAGHDTQFAIFGAGAAPDRPVLSSGTWEILMARCDTIDLPGPEIFNEAFTCEWDVLKGHYNPGFQYIASAVVEWIARTMYSELSGAERYETMIKEAMAAPQDCRGVTVNPNLLVGKGEMHHLSLNVDRGTLFRATLQGLVSRLQTGMAILQKVGNFEASELTLVGGGTRNSFWTQLKADALGIPVHTVDEAETTVLGAAMFALKGAGLHESAEAARAAFDLHHTTTLPRT
ncbi:L-fuculokinase [Cohaesibacter sp. ES.047]|uniref:L-fuculokinase n=1 Tax=Cohaesibacter sp. ES.047 TaxID=1798205 RepID=UPI000BB68C7A|nr:L-fuculokinase [Cohaesibacter sp. ES.047]SNY92227.1 L-fuculokinase [Cohaesibacter sp. ES.047]